jgi:hypothetical protein
LRNKGIFDEESFILGEKRDKKEEKGRRVGFLRGGREIRGN